MNVMWRVLNTTALGILIFILLVETLVSIAPLLVFYGILPFTTALILPELLSEAFRLRGQSTLLLVSASFVAFAAGSFTQMLKAVEELFFNLVGLHHDHGNVGPRVFFLQRQQLSDSQIFSTISFGICKLMIAISLTGRKKLSWVKIVLIVVPTSGCLILNFFSLNHYHLDHRLELGIQALLAATSLMVSLAYTQKYLLPFLLSCAPATSDVNIEEILKKLGDSLAPQARVSHCHVYRIYPTGFVAFIQIAATRSVNIAETVAVVNSQLADAGASKSFTEVVICGTEIDVLPPVCIHPECHAGEVACCFRGLPFNQCEDNRKEVSSMEVQLVERTEELDTEAENLISNDS